MDLMASWKHLATVSILTSQAAIAMHGGLQAYTAQWWRQTLSQTKVFSVRGIVVSSQASIFSHESEAADDVAHRQAGMVMMMVEFVIKGLEGCQCGVGASTADWWVSAVPQSCHAVVICGVLVIRLQAHDRASERGTRENSRDIPRVQHASAVLTVCQLYVAVH